MSVSCRNLLAIVSAASIAAGGATAQIARGYDPTKSGVAPATGAVTSGLDTDQKIGAFIPRELRFTSAEGKQVRLGDLFDLENGSSASGGKHRPVLVTLVYYDCPVVCSATMDKLAGAFRHLDYKIGKDFKVAYFSFDSTETAARAKQVKESYLVGQPDGLGDNGKFNPLIADNWNFFVGTAAANRELANALGFKYRVADNGQFAHSSVFMILTPDGRVARYLSPFLGDDKALAEQMKLALLEASDGKIAKGVSELMMSWCFMYDPRAGAYTLQAMQVMKIGAIVSIVAVGSLVLGMMVMERSRRRHRVPADAVGRRDEDGGTDRSDGDGHKPAGETTVSV
ncbi:MAG: SCO family protein [Phycisphaeraceae bacterium]|nr:SCO family protein [Phycisphaeraceae bacterium]